MFPARVEAHSNRCANCKFHSRPTWNTNGFGTCSRLTQANLLTIVNNDKGYLATHESFSCNLFSIKVK